MRRAVRLWTVLASALLAGCAAGPPRSAAPAAPPQPAVGSPVAPASATVSAGTPGPNPAGKPLAPPAAAGAPKVTPPGAAAKAAPLPPKAAPPQAAQKAPAPLRPSKVLDAAAEKVAAKLKALEQRSGSGAPGNAPDAAELRGRYEALLALPGTPPERRPEILSRLAELAYREEEAAARASYEGTGDVKPPAGGRYPRSIGYYRKLVDAYSDAPQALTAFYNLGYLYAEDGKTGLSAWAYQEVLRRDPSTPYADEIHMRLGEAAFDGAEVKEAIPHYQAVVDRGNPEYVDKALYKLGWSYYNLDDFPRAVDAFAKVLERSEKSPEDLRRETLEIMARSFLEWGGVDGVGRYLGRGGGRPAYGDRLYRAVGELYVGASRYDEAARAFVAGVDAYPLSPDCLEMEKGLVAALLTQRDAAGANGRRETWADRYGAGSPWDRANGAGPLGKARDLLLEEGLRLAALYQHNLAQRGQGSTAKAIDLYARYLKLFGGDTEAGYELAYSYAQALKEAGRLTEAQAQYRVVAEHPVRTAHREEASYRRIEVLQALYGKDPAVLGELLSAQERYATLNPGSPLVAQVLFSEGELLLATERFGEARSVYGRVAQGFPDSSFAPEALERIARCQFREAAYGEAEAAARNALSGRQATETRDRAQKLLIFSVFKQGEVREGAGDRGEANRHFLRLADEFPDSDVAQVSLNRAAENLKALGRQAEAAKVYDRIARSYPGTAYARNALGSSAQLLAALGDWQEAARNFEGLYRAGPDDEGAAEALFQAGLAFEKASDLAGAGRVFGEFSARYPQEPRRPEALYREGAALRAQGGLDGARQRFAAAWEASAEGDHNSYRARSALALGEMKIEEFRKLELKGNLEEALAQKEALLDEAMGFLAQAASLPYADSLTAALYQAGRAFEEMKESLLGSERPAELTAEEREQYDFLLEEKAAPLEEKAVEYYRKGVAAAAAAGVHTEWVDRMFERLEALVPWAYQRAEEAADAWTVPELPALRPTELAGGKP